MIVVNSSLTPEHFAATLPGRRVVPVDGLALSRRHGLGRIVNSALLGALARALEAPSLATLARVVASEAPKMRDENVAACEDGYRSVDTRESQVAL